MAGPPAEKALTPLLAEMPPAAKPPVLSRFTIAFAVSLLVGATFQLRPSVPLLVTGEPLTVKSDDGALSATLFTVPTLDGNVCPDANVIWPLLEIDSPVSPGVAVPDPNSRFNLPNGVAVLFPVGSACHRKVSFTAFSVLLLNDEAVKFSGCEFFPAAEVAGAVAGRLSAPRKMPVPVTSSLAAGAVLPTPTLVPLSKTCELAMSALASNFASLFTVPPAVVTGVVPVAGSCGEACVGVAFGVGVLVMLTGGAANTKAGAGSPPTVSASAAFSA